MRKIAVGGGSSSQGVDVEWSLTGVLPLSGVSAEGTGSFTLSGTLTNDRSDYPKYTYEGVKHTLNVSFGVNFERTSSGWVFPNLPLMIQSQDQSWSTSMPQDEYSLGYWYYFPGDGNYWITYSKDGNSAIRCKGTYSLVGAFSIGGYCDDDEDVGYNFSISKNTEIPLTYEEGVLVNFPIGTKECRWSATGGAYAVQEPNWDCPGYSSGANGFCKLVIKKGT